MKKSIQYLTLVVWAILVYILFRLDLLTGNTSNLNQFLNNCGNYKAQIFIALSSLRVAALIPSVVFMILGGVIFNPLEGVLLTLISVVLSESVVYITSRILVGSGIQSLLINKYPKLYKLLLKNNTKILAIGILCPIAPSDVVCFLASSTGLSYRKFILTVVISNMPMVILYGFLGNSFLSLGKNTIITAGTIIIISIYSIYVWNKEQRVQGLA